MPNLRHLVLLLLVSVLAAACSSAGDTLPTVFVPPTLDSQLPTFTVSPAQASILPTRTSLPPTWTPMPTMTPAPPRPTKVIHHRPTATMVILPSYTPSPERVDPTSPPPQNHNSNAALNAGYITVPLNISDATFQTDVLNSSLPVMVEYWATWCGSCQAIAPTIDEVAAEYSGRLQVVKIDVDANPGTLSQYAVEAIPTMLFFRNGVVVDRITGAVSGTTLRSHIDGVIE